MIRIDPIKDPVFQNRVVVGNSSFQMSTWTIIISLVTIVSIGVLGYFLLPPFISDQTEKPAIANPPTLTSEVTTAQAPAPPTASPETSKTTVTTAPVSPPTASVNPTSDKVATTPPAKAADSVSVASSRPSLPPNQESQGNTTVPNPAISSSPPVVATTPPTPPAPPTADSLFAKAQQQLVRQRLTSPAGDNAYETYQALAKLAPAKAQPILNAVVTWYLKQGRDYLNKGKLTQPKNANAYETYQKIQEIAPQHPDAKLFWDEMLTKLTKLSEKPLQDLKPTNRDIENAYALYQQMRTLIPESQETQRLLDNIVNRLLAKAAEQVAENKLNAPKNDNADDTYKKILELSPDNGLAKEGIQKIANKYYELAKTNQKLGKYASSLTMIQRGLEVLPNDPNLLQLKREVQESLSK